MCFLTLCSGRNLGFRRYGFDLDSLDLLGRYRFRRGRILGMDPLGNGEQVVLAEVPLAEMFKYATDLRSMTQGRGSFTSEFVRYEDVHANVAQKIIESAKKDDEDDE